MDKNFPTSLKSTNSWQALNAVSLQDQVSVSDNVAAELSYLLGKILSSELTDGGASIDYAAVKASTLYREFRDYTGKLRTFDPFLLPNQNARRAFWINLYNTLVLDGIIIRGICDQAIEHQVGRAFFRQTAYIVGGQRMSCDDIEHGILRGNRSLTFYHKKHFDASDPRRNWVIKPFDMRIHFALNCGSRSCPPILAYSPEKLDSQLELATRSHLAANIKIAHQTHTIYLSPIFKWFVGDFGGRKGILGFILSHVAKDTQFEWLMEHRNRISFRYTPYDWSLNSKIQLENV